MSENGLSHPYLSAWRQRGDTKTLDALWRAACWEASALERSHPRDRKRELGMAGDIANADSVATAAVATLPMRYPGSVASRVDRAVEWPTAQKGAWL